MPQDVGKTIISKELESSLAPETDLQPDTQLLSDTLPYVTAKVTSIAGLEANVKCTLMMLDTRSATLADFPTKSAVALVRERRDNLVATIDVITDVGTFAFDGKSDISISVSGAFAIVTLVLPHVE